PTCCYNALSIFSGTIPLLVHPGWNMVHPRSKWNYCSKWQGRALSAVSFRKRSLLHIYWRSAVNKGCPAFPQEDICSRNLLSYGGSVVIPLSLIVPANPYRELHRKFACRFPRLRFQLLPANISHCLQ